MKINEKMFADGDCGLYIDGYKAASSKQSIIDAAVKVLEILNIKVTSKDVFGMFWTPMPNNEAPLEVDIGENEEVKVSYHYSKVYYSEENSYAWECKVFFEDILVDKDGDPQAVKQLLDSLGFKTKLIFEKEFDVESA